MSHASRWVIVFGETLVDLVPRGDVLHPVAGGGPFNTAVAAAKLGAPTALISIVSDDALGRGCIDRASAAGVDTRLLVRSDAPTTLALPDIDATGSATYRFYWAGTTNDLPTLDIPEPPPGFVPAVVHVASLATVLWPARDNLFGWLRDWFPDVPITFDLNIRPALLPDAATYLERIEPWLKACVLVRASDEDVEFLYPGTRLDDVAATWFRRYPDLATALITCGAAGTLTYRRSAQEPLRTPVFPTTVVDTVGAGDTFTGAFLDGYFRRGIDITEAVRQASVAAAITCSRVGAVPPTAAEVEQTLRARLEAH